jgi:hypothetical protein
VGWSTQQNAVDPARPVPEQVMDVVDEVVLMDYFTGCDSALSTASVRCDPQKWRCSGWRRGSPTPTSC